MCGGLVSAAATPSVRLSDDNVALDDEIVTCVGDCNGDGVVRIGEIVAGVDLALAGAAAGACPAFECNPPGLGVFVNCVVVAVGNALNGCATPTVRTEGACCLGDCTAGTTDCGPQTQDACCDYARYSEIALAIWWCPPDQFDPATNHCTACVDPCLGLPPPDAAPTPTPSPPDFTATQTATPIANETPYPLSGLQDPCGSETGAALLAGVRPEYEATLMSRPETPWPALLPFTLRLTYRGGAITCYPPYVPPPGSKRPFIREQVGVVMQVDFKTENGAFAETVDTELKGGGRGGDLCFSRRPEEIEGTYRPDLPGYDDVLVSACGNFWGDWTNGVVFQTGVPPGHVSEFIPIAYWQPTSGEPPN